MKNRKSLTIVLFLVLILACSQINALAQANSDSAVANISSAGSSVRWDLKAGFGSGTLTISAPDGRIFTREFKGGASPDFSLTDVHGERLPDGQYSYEIRLGPAMSKSAQDSLKAARGKDDEPESVRASRKRVAPTGLVQSGSFSVVNGSVMVPGTVEESGSQPATKAAVQMRPPAAATAAFARMAKRHHMALLPDQVIPDDLIVQGSACVGLDCVNNEVFDFDTVRLKENNTRLQFNDTSISAGFPTTNWQIRANDSGGGSSFLGFVDQGATGSSESGTIVFRTDAGAPANSLRVSSTGRIGIRTATPVLDVHANTSDTPAIRLEQNNSGGFSAQTWDIAGNEANFFVRDVTSGSRLPFRIRPGAPTSSLDISADGDVGIATAAPALRLEVLGTAGLPATNGTTQTGITRLSQSSGVGVVDFGFGGAAGTGWIQATSSANLATNFGLLLNPNGGNVGIGTTAPTALLSVNGTANKPGGGSWDVFSDERLKNIKGRFTSGLEAVMQLQPIRYEYKPANALNLDSKPEHIGFGAQQLEKVIPEAVTRNANGYLQVSNDPIIWAMLNAIQEQQKEIQQLRTEIQQLRARTQK